MVKSVIIAFILSFTALWAMMLSVAFGGVVEPAWRENRAAVTVVDTSLGLGTRLNSSSSF
jgi:hypothetical protein